MWKSTTQFACRNIHMTENCRDDNFSVESQKNSCFSESNWNNNVIFFDK